MRKQRRCFVPGVTAWRATLNIALGSHVAVGEALTAFGTASLVYAA